MTAYFTHYWTNQTWDYEASLDMDGLRHTASNLFRQRGIRIGDWVYIITVKKGVLLVAGKLRVDRLANQIQAIKYLGTRDLWDASDHIISDKSYPVSFDCRIPISIYPQLLFETVNGPQPPHLIEHGRLDQQTLRGVRQLTPAGARLLDQYIASPSP